MRKAWNTSARKNGSSNTRKMHNTNMRKITAPCRKIGNTMWEE
jgi:hypothetical protein